MSELMKLMAAERNIRWQLLATTSAIALIAAACSTELALAEGDDVGHPTVWIELGGQLSRLGDGQDAFEPPLMDGRPSLFSSAKTFQTPPRHSFDEFGKISITPSATDWELSASVRYGRAKSVRDVRQQTVPHPFTKYYYSNYPTVNGAVNRLRRNLTAVPVAAKFADTELQISEQHLLLDFQAGKDVGLGMFGLHGSSVVSVGVRFAQFISKSNIALKSNPDWHFHYKYFPSVVSTLRPSSKFPQGEVYHSNQASLHATRSFHGIGPSISWNASAALAGGSSKDSELTFDWGMNAAILFGRQKAKIQHHTTGRYHGAKYDQGNRVITYQPTPVNISRFKSIIVPNVGGFAGFSYRYTDAKISLGYRADFFFGAMDGGIDTHKSENVGFHGPFATISLGLGG